MTIEIILLALSPVFMVFISYEFIKHRRYYDIKDSLANTALALMHQGSEAIALLLLMPFFYWLYGYRLFDIELSAISILVAFILQDFLYYWFHKASHHIRNTTIESFERVGLHTVNSTNPEMVQQLDPDMGQ